jgi:hypothetical protein
MRRRPFIFPAGVSLLICVAMAALWINSYRRADMVVLPIGPGFAMSAARGAILMGWIGPRNRPPVGASLNHLHYVYPLSGVTNPHPYFIQYNQTAGVLLLSIPMWLVILIAASACIAFGYPRRPNPGHCTTCGYDLRATPERCPECGTAPEKKVIAPK